MIDVHQNATLSEFFEDNRSRVIGNRYKELACNILKDSVRTIVLVYPDQVVVFPSDLKLNVFNFLFCSWLYNLFDSYIDGKIKGMIQDKVKYKCSH